MERDSSPHSRHRGYGGEIPAGSEYGEMWKDHMRNSYGDMDLPIPPEADVPDLPTAGPTEILGDGAGKINDSYGD